MGIVSVDISVSLDGFIAGPDAGRAHPLGIGGEALHEWAISTKGWREPHGEEGGEAGPDSEIIERVFANVGAIVMGRRAFGGEDGPWGDDPWEGWWGDEPPFHVPVYVLTNHARKPLETQDTTFHFVTDGSESALSQAKEAAGDQDVAIGGGASVIQQYLRAAAIDELQLHVVALFLGGGTRLFEEIPPTQPEIIEVVASPAVTHIRYRLG